MNVFNGIGCLKLSDKQPQHVLALGGTGVRIPMLTGGEFVEPYVFHEIRQLGVDDGKQLVIAYREIPHDGGVTFQPQRWFGLLC